MDLSAWLKLSMKKRRVVRHDELAGDKGSDRAGLDRRRPRSRSHDAPAVRLSDDDAGSANSLAGQTIHFAIDGITWTATTGDRGVAEVIVEVPRDRQRITVTSSFAGNELYEASSLSTTLTPSGG